MPFTSRSCFPRIFGRLAPASASTPDRKSTRLNSSHVEISYAVFCLKKKSPHSWSGIFLGVWGKGRNSGGRPVFVPLGGAGCLGVLTSVHAVACCVFSL